MTGINNDGWSNAEFGAKVERRPIMKRRGNPEEIAAVASFLLSTGAFYITGTNVVADGGISL